MSLAPNSTISQPRLREHGEGIEVDAFVAAGVDHDVVEAFEADGAMLHDLRNVVGADEDVGPSDD